MTAVYTIFKRKCRNLGVSNGPVQLKVLAKFGLAKMKRLFACSCAQNGCNCSHARILDKMCSIARNFVNPAL